MQRNRGKLKRGLAPLFYCHMVNLISKLEKWASDFLEGSEQFLVYVENKPGSSKYRILIDGIEPISIKQCADLSRHVSKLIDEDTSLDEDEYFTFEVSSPGADKPLKFIKQYFKHIGRQLLVTTNDDKTITGTLEAIEGETLVFLVKISKKETAQERIEFRDIKEANVIISFKETKK